MINEVQLQLLVDFWISMVSSFSVLISDQADNQIKGSIQALTCNFYTWFFYSMNERKLLPQVLGQVNRSRLEFNPIQLPIHLNNPLPRNRGDEWSVLFGVMIAGRAGKNNPNKMSYLSPLVCGARTEMATSESNLSSSGYSSMASPGLSPSCSSKTLCILEEDMACMGRLSRKKERRKFQRILSPSLESSSPPDSPDKAGAFFQRISRMVNSDSVDIDDQLTKPVEHESTADYDSNDEGIRSFLWW